VLSYIEVWL